VAQDVMKKQSVTSCIFVWQMEYSLV